MGYADYKFYREKYYGDTINSDNAPKWLETASDVLDGFTFGRLTAKFPLIEAHADKVKKAVCALADALYMVDIQKKATSATKNKDGEIHGAVASVSSGRESISYVSKGADSIYGEAASSETELKRLLYKITLTYLTSIPDSSGINLLYGGFDDV